MATDISDSSFLSGANSAFIQDLYAKWLQDANAVDIDWARFFNSLNDDARAVLKEHHGASWAPKTKRAPVNGVASDFAPWLDPAPLQAKGKPAAAPATALTAKQPEASADQIREATLDSRSRPAASSWSSSPTSSSGLVTAEVGGSALFASRFRECAARALLLPRRDPGRRTPLWQQRQRSAAAARGRVEYPSFPIVLEAVRECLQDVYDLPALVELMRRVDRREVQVVDVPTHAPSPFARSPCSSATSPQFIYEGDSPLAERRAAALSLDQGLLAELLGRAELRELLDPDVLAEVEAELQRLAPDRRVRDAEGVADLLRLLGR